MEPPCGSGRRTAVNRRLSLIPALIPALALGALLALAGCGSSDEPTAVDAGSDSTVAPSTSTPGTVWAADCSPSTSSLDYGREPEGWKTPEEAVAHAGDLGIPDGTLMLAPEKAHAPMSVYVVDDATGTILASVSVFQGSTGFYVDGVTTCG